MEEKVKFYVHYITLKFYPLLIEFTYQKCSAKDRDCLNALLKGTVNMLREVAHVLEITGKLRL